jgi:transposase
MQQPIRMSEEVRGGEVGMCSRVQYVYGRWYLLVPYKAEAIQMQEVPSRIGAYDAGVRTFLTTYSEEDAEEIGLETYSVIDRVHKKIDGIKKRLEKEEMSPKRRSKLRKAWYRAHARATNLATDFHFKVIKHLLDKFDVLVAPRLNVQQLISREGNLKAITKRRLAFLAHGKFRMRLLMKAQQRNKIVVDLEEHGTSKTCCRCGVTNWKLGSSKVFKCKWCSLIIDRDINSAINHMIKFIFGKDDY